MRGRVTWVVWLMVAVVAAAAPASAQQGAAPAGPEEFTGQIVNTSGGGSWSLQLTVDSLTPDEEALALEKILAEQGRDALVAAVRGTRERGRLRLGDSLGYPVTIVRSRPTERGRRIVALTDRPIQFVEISSGLRSEERPFGAVVLDLGADGKGEGKLIGATWASFINGQVNPESAGADPIKIIRVKSERPVAK